jgi:DNA-binding NarL/FixJ family response regulator
MPAPVHIALVDDHTLLRRGLAALIDTFDGYKVLFEANNGEDFIQQIKPGMPPDIVLLDISMPGMNGYETAKWIRQNLPETKVLVLSFMENNSAIIRMLKLGARGYILKDSDPRICNQALNSIRDSGFFLNELVSNRVVQCMTNGKEVQDILSILTDRELQFLKLACTEMTYKQIAVEMGVSPRTVDSYRDALFHKLGVSSRIGLVIFAIRNGIVKV